MTLSVMLLFKPVFLCFTHAIYSDCVLSSEHFQNVGDPQTDFSSALFASCPSYYCCKPPKPPETKYSPKPEYTDTKRRPRL